MLPQPPDWSEFSLRKLVLAAKAVPAPSLLLDELCRRLRVIAVFHVRRLAARAHRRLDTDAAVQEVWFELYQAVKGYDPDAGAPATYFSAVARNCAHDWLKRQGNDRLTFGVDLTALADRRGESCAPDLRAILGVLPLELRIVFVLDVEGYTAAKTADLLGSTPDAVRQQLYRARQKLRESLGGHD